MIHRFHSQELYLQGRAARRAARRHYEICGLIVHDGSHLRLVPVKNSAHDLGRLEMIPIWWRSARNSNGYADWQVVGTYHSHPASPAEPGEGDINGTWNGALMLIFARWGVRHRLWRIRDGLAKSLTLAKSYDIEGPSARM